MNQYTDELILNSDIWTAISETTTEANKAFRVKGMANFRKSAADYAMTYKLATEGSADSASIKIEETRTNAAGSALSWDKEGVYRLWIELGERNSHTSEFQNSLTRENKVLAFEVTAATASAAATALKKAIEKYNRDSKNVKVTVAISSSATDTLVLTAVDEFVTIKKCELHAVVLEPGYSLTGYDHFEVIKEATITAGAASFGTTSWLVRNLRMPTYVNTNWTAIQKDDRPIPGEKYDEIVIVMKANRGELTGMGAIGQELTSVTRHVFYVRHSVAASFIAVAEAALGVTAAAAKAGETKPVVPSTSGEE